MPRFTFSAYDLPFMSFSQLFSDKTGKGLVFDASLDNEKVTADFKNATSDEILSLISRRYGKKLLIRQDTYYLGDLKREDRGYFLFRIKSYQSDQILPMVTSMLSELGRASVTSDGLLVVSDTTDVLLTVRQFLDDLSKFPLDSWICQFFLILERNDFRVDYGAEVQTSGQLSYLLSKGEGGELSYDKIGQQLQLVFNAQSNLSTVHASPMLLLVDGKESSWQDGTKIPVPQKTVSDAGTVTTSGFTYIDTGLLLKCLLRESSEGAVLTYNLSDSTITGYTEYQPIVRISKIDSSVSVKSGSIYLLGELQREDDRNGLAQTLSLSKEKAKTNMQVFVRLYKISAPGANQMRPRLRGERMGRDDSQSAESLSD